MKKAWSKVEIGKLKELWAIADIDEISRAIPNRTIASLYLMASRLRLKKSRGD